jgi:hypothetical protein
MTDTLKVLRSLASDPVPYVNTTVLFGLTYMQWELLFKILIGLGSAVWTGLKIYAELKRIKGTKPENL